MKYFVMLLLFLPTVQALSIGVAPHHLDLDHTNTIHIFNPNNKEIDYTLTGPSFKQQKGTIQPNKETTVKLEHDHFEGEEYIYIDITTKDTNGIKLVESLAIKVTKLAQPKPQINPYYLLAATIFLLLCGAVMYI